MNDYCVYVMTGAAEDKEKKIKEIIAKIEEIKIQ